MESELTIDKIICELYKEFYENNKSLFKKDKIEYWSLASKYKEINLKKRLYAMASSKTSLKIY
jgi:hypothetical protein